MTPFLLAVFVPLAAACVAAELYVLRGHLAHEAAVIEADRETY